MSDQNTDHQGQSQALKEAENHFKEAWEIFQREANKLRQEQESFDSMSKKLDQVHFSSTVELNVGGQRFTTSVQTLTKDPNSMLAAMFSGRFEMKPSKDGSFFIDRDGTHFRFILNYLRTGKLTLPEGASFLKELEEEVEFYQIQGIIDALRPAISTAVKLSEPFVESVILTNEEHRRVLKGWLPAALVCEWRLLFRASRDGFSSSSFHSKCDNKGPTITVVKSGGNIFGGFTDKSWTSLRGGQGGYRACIQAFLFSMVNPSGLVPTKMPLFPGMRDAICCQSGCGPTFGGGYDLFISNNANTNTDSYSNLGFTYEIPPGQQNTFFTGDRFFFVTDYEVFGLQQ